MPCYKAARKAIGGLPARRPTVTGIIILWRGIESQPGNDSKSVALACIDGYPFASAALTVLAEFGRAHRRTDQTRRPKRIGDSAGAIIAEIVK